MTGNLLKTCFYHFFKVKIWFQNRRTKWKKQENISNAEAAELMKAKNTTKDILNGFTNNSNKLQKPNSNKPLTPESLMDKLSPGPSSSPFLRPSSATSSSNSFYQEQNLLNKSMDSPIQDRCCVNNDDDEDRLVIAEPTAVMTSDIKTGHNNNNGESAADEVKADRYLSLATGRPSSS